jgi:mitochondrial import inner membrane translocase subunit TIM44
MFFFDEDGPTQRFLFFVHTRTNGCSVANNVYHEDILSRSEEAYEKSGAKKVKERVDHLTEDAREAWETSQNPWVYRISSVYETFTAETPEAIAVAELRKLDPDFTLDDWRQDVVEHTLPKIMEWLLKGKINQLKPWLDEGVFRRIAAEITARKQEGVQMDTHVLGIMNSEILAVESDEVNKGSPIIVLHFMCQQINCVRKKSDGTVVEGSEDDIRANSYVAAFQREYDEGAGELNWKIIDFRFNGAIAYL